MTPYLLHCLACDDLRNVRKTVRISCACGLTSARSVPDAVVLVGPGRIVDAALQDADVPLIRPSVAVAT